MDQQSRVARAVRRIENEIERAVRDLSGAEYQSVLEVVEDSVSTRLVAYREEHEED